MKLPSCARCGQPRTPDQLIQGRCLNCRRKHACNRHPAGSSACYTRHGCRCAPCRTAANRDKKRYAALPSPLVDATPTRRHIQSLLNAGHTIAWVAGRIGRSKSYIEYLHGTARRLHPRIAREILAIRPDTDGGMVDSTGTVRRIQALAVIGWPTSWLDAKLGQTKGYTHHVLTAPRVLHRTAKRYAALYDQLWDSAPPSETRDQLGAVTRTKRWAERNWWSPAAAWDDGRGPHGIDNPDATPATTISPQRVKGEIAEEVGRLIGTDSTDSISHRLGYRDRNGLYAALRRTGRNDLAERLITAQQAEYDALRETKLGEIYGPQRRKKVA